jgi:cytochrome c-type biogenesis protein CcmH/NrfF
MIDLYREFLNPYGERALVVPRQSGFNLLAWFATGTAVVLGALGAAA